MIEGTASRHLHRRSPSIRAHASCHRAGNFGSSTSVSLCYGRTTTSEHQLSPSNFGSWQGAAFSPKCARSTVYSVGLGCASSSAAGGYAGLCGHDRAQPGTLDVLLNELRRMAEGASRRRSRARQGGNVLSDLACRMSCHALALGHRDQRYCTRSPSLMK